MTLRFSASDFQTGDDEELNVLSHQKETEEDEMEEGEILIYPHEEDDRRQGSPASSPTESYFDQIDRVLVEAEADLIDWQTPRLWESPSSLRQFILPGILKVVTTEEGELFTHRADRVAQVLQQHLEKSALIRLTRNKLRPGREDCSLNQTMCSEETKGEDWWLFNQSYGVVFLGSISEQYYIKYLYQHVFIKARKDTSKRLNQMVNLLRRKLPTQVEGRTISENLSSFPYLSRESLSTRIFVFPLIEESNPTSLPIPIWLPFTKELPPNVPPVSLQITRSIAVYSHYLYRNYRRWMESILFSFFSFHQIDYVTIIHELVVDLMDGRINHQDIFQFFAPSYYMTRSK
ncbi:unnamed protein product [Phytomonas sp. Hart1]|nr:unnamed protein product [Phytomonas sp. Hart1]|eukprot:CCW66080.1 unnamed protein product [Phytomonas sp. isolate Hart1]